MSAGGVATPPGAGHNRKESGDAAAATPTVTNPHLSQSARVKLFMSGAWIDSSHPASGPVPNPQPESAPRWRTAYATIPALPDAGSFCRMLVT